MYIIGIDCSLTNTGVAILSYKSGGLVLHNTHCFTTSRMDCPETEKYFAIYKWLFHKLSFLTPKDIVAIEQYFTSFYNMHASSKVHQARGAVLAAIHHFTTKLFEVHPVTVKSFLCGDSSADKVKIAHTLQVIFGQNLSHLNNHETDAIGIALTGIGLHVPKVYNNYKAITMA